MKKEKFKFLEHTGDIKIKAFGKTLNETFQNAALAVSSYLSRGKKIKISKEKIIKVSGIDQKSLFYNFLDELIYLLDAEHFITASAKVKIKGNTLTASLKGDNASNYQDLDHIKAATYAEMHIKKISSGFQAQAVLDV